MSAKNKSVNIIAIDLRPLQTGHQFRGIGEVVKRTVQHILMNSDKSKHFVMLAYDNLENPMDDFDIPDTISFELRRVGPPPSNTPDNKTKIVRILRRLFGNPVPWVNDCDILLQYDYELGVSTSTPTLLVKHDIIPYMFREQYFISPTVHVKNKAARTTLRTIYHNYTYSWVLKRSLRNAKHVVCVSNSTQNDLIKHLNVKEKKTSVVHLGIDSEAIINHLASSKERVPKSISKPYLLFIGAVDGQRRAVVDLIDAYNNLKADGHDLQLVLVGENFELEKGVLDDETKYSLIHSSYSYDIKTLGYVSDEVKFKLYKNALAFVFPTRYEGFGIPILEAMASKCPVITYSNSSIPEVAGESALITGDWMGIAEQVSAVINWSPSEKEQFVGRASEQVDNFDWQKTSKVLVDALTSQITAQETLRV